MISKSILLQITSKLKFSFKQLKVLKNLIMEDHNEAKEWNIFLGKEDNALNLGNYGILILNMPINLTPGRISELWNNACWRMTVDGGTDRWFDFVKQHSLTLPLPDCVTGDFDSIRPETLEYCQKQNQITVQNTPDQDYTDFDKAVKVLTKSCPHKLDCFLAVLEHSGRLDQTFSNLNTLSKVMLQGYVISESCITWLLHKGHHNITIPDYLCHQKEYCGILPLSTPAKVTSTGLKWNLNDDIIQFGGLISSSNTYESSPVFINTDNTIIWTMSYGNA